MGVGRWISSWVSRCATGTQDIDIFLSSEQQLRHLKDDLNDKFHQIGPHALEHKSTGIEIETLTPEFLKIDQQIVDTAIRSAEMSDGIRVLSREGLVALKLMRANNRDKGDIEAIIQAGGPVSLDEYKLTSEQRQVYQALAEIVKHQQRLE